uniref:RNA helicase n=1 Tax=Piliocolobus tephrosceles TaxID=591936 RepID=A0A8C9LN72_9PRIM
MLKKEIVVNCDSNTAFESKGPVEFKNENKEVITDVDKKIEEMNVSDDTEIEHEYIYTSEHLQITKNNNVFMSQDLNDYIKKHVDWLFALGTDFFENKNDIIDDMVDLSIKLKYLSYKDYLKKTKKKNRREKKKKEKCKKHYGTEGKKGDEKSEECIRKNNIVGIGVGNTTSSADYIIDRNTNVKKQVENGEKSCFEQNPAENCPSVLSPRLSEYDSPNNSDSSFMHSFDSDYTITGSYYKHFTSTSRCIFKNFEFDKEELQLIKQLEKAKNIYVSYMQDLFYQYNKMKPFYSLFANPSTGTFDNNTKDERVFFRNVEENCMKLVNAFYANETMLHDVKKAQNELRSDILKSMFGFNIMNDTKPLKLFIKNVNNLTYQNKHVSKICSYKSSQSKNRIETKYDNDYFKEFNYPMVKKAGCDDDNNNNSSTVFDVGSTINEKMKDSNINLDEKKISTIMTNADTKKIATVTVNPIDDYIKQIQGNVKIMKKANSLKEYNFLKHYNGLKKHNNYLCFLHEEKKKNQKSFAYLCLDVIKNIKQKKEVIIEKEEKERMRLLRENDMDAYIKLVQNTKNKKIQQLLDVTANFLTNMSKSVLRQKQQASGNICTTTGCNHDECILDCEYQTKNNSQNYKEAREQYYTISHTIKEKVKQPSILIGGNLMKYQLDGLEWLVSLYNNKLNGILADDMGLGKTVQTISLFAYLKEYKKEQFEKNIIIVPLSTLPNWVSEFEKWCPSLRVITYRGTKLERYTLSKTLLHTDFDICLTTFDYIIKEKSLLMKVSWGYIVIDEGHRMKNNKSCLHKILSEFKSKNRILLTGTPLQNNMAELWALLNFLLPEVFSSSVDFEQWFSDSLSNEQKDVCAQIKEEEQLLIINRLHTMLLPFMLRRIKKDVLTCLPKKYEYNIYIDMSLYQKMMYRNMQKKKHKQISGNGYKTTKSFQNLLMQLRKIVNHPYLFLDEYNIDDMIIKCSAKFELLDRMLPKLLKFNHKILIFSQMTTLMDVLCDYLEYRNYGYHRLDGTVSFQDRKHIIEEFNRKSEVPGLSESTEAGTTTTTTSTTTSTNTTTTSTNTTTTSTTNTTTTTSNIITPECKETQYKNESKANIFILSTRSGSLGLNLQSADTVIIFDSDFNPHQDIQAMCRCHRMGQNNVVKVFRFITLSGVEDMIFKRAKEKLSMNDKVIQAGLFNKIYNDEDRQNKLKNILKKNQNMDDYVTTQPTNPISVNHFMSRSDKELEYFMNYDKNYFGESHFTTLHEMYIANPKCEQFTYLSEDEQESESESESERKGESERESEGERENNATCGDHHINADYDTYDNNKDQQIEHPNNDSTNNNNSNINVNKNKRKYNNLIQTNGQNNGYSERGERGERSEMGEMDERGESCVGDRDLYNYSNMAVHSNNKKAKLELNECDNTKKFVAFDTEENVIDAVSVEKVESGGGGGDGSSSSDGGGSNHGSGGCESSASKSEETITDYYAYITSEQNQSEIEKILISTNKLINKQELSANYFFEEDDDVVEEVQVDFKRTRKVINKNLWDEEKLTEDQFIDMYDPASSASSDGSLSENEVKDTAELGITDSAELGITDTAELGITDTAELGITDFAKQTIN